jgi:hypothetical protein
MKYTLKISGRGGENYLHKLSQEQYDKLSELDLEEAEQDEITEILKVDSVVDTDYSILGSYTDPESVFITVYDDQKNVVFESNEDTDLNYKFNQLQLDGDYLVIQDYVKGDFQEFEIESENFDLTKLNLVVTEIGYELEAVTRITYDNQELEPVDYGDYWSKGLYFYLV